MSEGITEFTVGLNKFADEAVKEAVSRVKRTALGIFRRVIEKTPVDKGILRGSWNLSVGAPDESVAAKGVGANSKGKITTGETSKGLSAIAGFTATNMVMIWLSNSMPYVATVEFGGYPNPVKKGTYVPRGKDRDVPGGGVFTGPGYVVLSSGGFSKQAPTGMLMLSIEEELAELRSKL